MTGRPRILVINPNSTEAVTAAIREAVAGVPGAAAVRIDCMTPAEGPPGIETDLHVRQVVAPLVALARISHPGQVRHGGYRTTGQEKCAARCFRIGQAL